MFKSNDLEGYLVNTRFVTAAYCDHRMRNVYGKRKEKFLWFDREVYGPTGEHEVEWLIQLSFVHDGSHTLHYSSKADRDSDLARLQAP